MIGQTLDGRYEIVEEVGRGGIGVVYRARQLTAKGRDVAVKVLLPSAQASHNAVQRFENEAAIIGTLRHPNTIRMFDTGRTTDGRLYVVTEFLVGETLMERVERGALSQLATVKTLIPIARSLEEAHAHGIVHRDLKLANIFLERVGAQEVVKVLDFGIAKLVDHARITAPMQIFGTPGYMAPEQCRGGVVGPSADLFALGVLGYVMLALRFPYDGVDAGALLVATLTKTARPLSETRPEMTWVPALEGLVMQLLAYDPADRPPSAAAAADALENVLKSIDRTAGLVRPGRMVPLEPDTPADVGDDLLTTLPIAGAPRPGSATTDPPLDAASLLHPSQDEWTPATPLPSQEDESSPADPPMFDGAVATTALRAAGASPRSVADPDLRAAEAPSPSPVLGDTRGEPRIEDEAPSRAGQVGALRHGTDAPSDDELPLFGDAVATTAPRGALPPIGEELPLFGDAVATTAPRGTLPPIGGAAPRGADAEVLRATVPRGGPSSAEAEGLLDTLPVTLDAAGATVRLAPTGPGERPRRARPSDGLRNVLLVLGIAAVLGSALLLAFELLR